MERASIGLIIIASIVLAFLVLFFCVRINSGVKKRKTITRSSDVESGGVKDGNMIILASTTVNPTTGNCGGDSGGGDGGGDGGGGCGGCGGCGG